MNINILGLIVEYWAYVTAIIGGLYGAHLIIKRRLHAYLQKLVQDTVRSELEKLKDNSHPKSLK